MSGATIGSGSGAAPHRRGWTTILVVAAAALAQLVVLVPFTVASGLVAPLWAIVVLHLVWVGAAALLVRTARRRPLATPLIPLGNAALLYTAISLGEAVLGWTA